MPGNIISGAPPGMNSFPPMARKIFLFASTSLEMMCQWPIVRPSSLNGAGCADALPTASADASAKIEANAALFMDTSLCRLFRSAGWTRTLSTCGNVRKPKPALLFVGCACGESGGKPVHQIGRGPNRVDRAVCNRQHPSVTAAFVAILREEENATNFDPA